MPFKSEQIYSHVYAISGDEAFPAGGDVSSRIVYAPLAGMVLECDASDVEQLRGALCDGTGSREMADIARSLKAADVELPPAVGHPEQYAKMSVLSNYKCNLSCSYCYSAAGRSSKEIAPAKLQAALDYFVGHARSGERRSLFFSGGGEPLLSWRLVMPQLQRAIELALAKGVTLEVHFMTNGTIYTDEIAAFMKAHGITLCFSYEILDDLQDCLRGRSRQVAANISRYLAAGCTLYVSSTITPQSVDRMEEMVRSVAERFPGIGTITMEPVTGASLYDTPEGLAAFYRTFDDVFERAGRLARSYGISLNTSCRDVTAHFVRRYCPGKLCLAPEGTFTICHCASSPLEERYAKCAYGRVGDDGTVSFDMEHFRELVSTCADSYPECRDCFAKVHCGGECMTRRDTYPSDFMREVCLHTQRRVFREIKQMLDDE